MYDNISKLKHLSTNYMSIKLTAKQESFAQAIASGVSQAAAYRIAYDHEGMSDVSIYQESCKLNKNPKITLRVAELRAPVIKKAQVTLESHIAELQRLAKVAEDNGNVQAAIKAVELTGKVSGLYVEKIDQNVSGGLTVEIVRFSKGV